MDLVPPRVLERLPSPVVRRLPARARQRSHRKVLCRRLVQPLLLAIPAAVHRVLAILAAVHLLLAILAVVLLLLAILVAVLLLRREGIHDETGWVVLQEGRVHDRPRDELVEALDPEQHCRGHLRSGSLHEYLLSRVLQD